MLGSLRVEQAYQQRTPISMRGGGGTGERERGERQTDRQTDTDRQTETDRHRQTDRQTDRGVYIS